jgi:hypothetical protein
MRFLRTYFYLHIKQFYCVIWNRHVTGNIFVVCQFSLQLTIYKMGKEEQ